jgi:diguanylate cyclase (GGDEF)-like protein/PAS domain S-box-containing protein
LERTRFGFGVFALLLVALAIPLVVVADSPAWLRALAAVALVWTAARHVQIYRSDRVFIGLVPVDGAALLALIAAVGAEPILGVLFTGVYSRSMYGDRRYVVANAAATLAAYLTSSFFLPIDEAVAIDTALSQVPGILVSAAVTHIVADALRREERRRARERLLRESGGRLVVARDRDEIHRVGVEASLAALPHLPGTRAVLWRGDGEELEAVAAAGDGAADVTGKTMSLALIPPAEAQAFRAGEVIRVDADRGVRDRPVLGFRMKTGGALVVPLRTPRQWLGALVTSSDHALPAEAEDTMRALASQVALALEGEQLTADLHRRRSEERFGSLIRNASDVITVVDAAHIVRYQTPSITRVLGLDPEAVVGRPIVELVHPGDVPAALAFLAHAAELRESTDTAEWRMAHRDGTWRRIEVVAGNLTDDENIRGLVLTSRDVTERKALERRLAHQAFHDSLTGLANRDLFRNRVEHAMSRARRAGGAAVLFVDVDDFKNVNDTLGHAAGDRMLAQVADRLRGCVRPGDTAARLGGDEFGVLLEDVGDAEAAAAAAARVLAALERPLALDDRVLEVRASIGIALTGPDVDGAEELLRNADIAMYAAKGEGKSRVRVFEPAMYAETLDRVELIDTLAQAEARGELVLHYQPIVALETGRAIGAEALIRWQHPERGLLHPGDFVALAEQSRLILPIGRWVIREACRQLRAWRDEDPSAGELRVGVNLAPGQLVEARLVDDVARALRDYDLEPASLVLEITESAVMEDLETGLARLHELSALGVSLALDDFGTGYSSLSYLQRFPLDILKLDRSFTDELRDDARESRLPRAIIELGQLLGLVIVAEGVEDEGQARRLRKLGCELAQGYHFARPVAADRFLATVAELRGIATLPGAA